MAVKLALLVVCVLVSAVVCYPERNARHVVRSDVYYTNCVVNGKCTFKYIIFVFVND